MGEIDDQALLEMAPLTPQTLAQWEHYLRQQDEVEQVAVLTQEHSRVPLPLHLDDLLPDWGLRVPQPHVPEEEGSPAQAPRQSEDRGNTAGAPLSLARGRELRLEPEITTLPQMLLRAAAPDNQAHLTYLLPDGRELVSSYPQLLSQARQVLAGLRLLGLRPQDKVIIQVEACQEFLPILWGCLLGGIIAVPVAIAPTYAQPTSASTRLFHAWNLLGQPIVVAGSTIATPLRSLAEDQGWHEFSVVPYPTLQACTSEAEPFLDSQPDDLALILLTSGSTGAPKGVMQCHRSLLSQIQGMIQQLGCTPRQGLTFNWMPLDHVGGVVMLHFHALFLAQSQVHTLPQYVLHDPLRWLDAIERYQATTTWAPNFAFGLLNERAEELSQRQWDLSSMQHLINAGEAIVATVAATFLQVLQPHGLPATAMRPVWGMSETCSGVTFTIFPAQPAPTSQLVEVGEPIPGFALRLVDGEDQLVEQGRIGRLQAQGPSVTRGYYHNAQATDEAFTADGWFDTGDLGLMRQGQLTITGRAKDTIIINGINYYSQEIEAAVEELEEVETSYTAACAVREGESATDQLAVFVVSRLDEDQVLEVLKKVRAKVSARVGITPTYVLPVEPDDIPKTGIGKIQRPQIKQAFEAGHYRERVKQLDRLQGNANTLPDWLYRPSWQRLELPQLPLQVDHGRTLIITTAATAETGKALSEQLQQQEHQVLLLQWDPNQAAEQVAALATTLATTDRPVTRVVQFGEPAPVGDEAPPQEHLDAMAHRIHDLRTLVQLLAREQRREEEPLTLLTVSTAADELDSALQAPMSGFVKTLSRELPWLHAIHLTLASTEPALASAQILAELAHNQTEPEVTYQPEGRYVHRLAPIDWPSLPSQSVPLRRHGVYLLSGGSGGLGVELASHLLQEFQAHLLLLGRTPISLEGAPPDPETPAGRLAHLQALASRHGGTVHYACVDVCDLSAVQAALAQAQQTWLRPLDGIFHLAGEFHEQVMLQETNEQIEASLRPKVLGAWTLHQLLKDRPGTLFVSSSSVNAFFGGRAVGAYAAANAFLEAFAHYQRVHCGLQSYCLSWSMWDEIGMSRGYQLKAFSQAQGFQSISPAQGWYSLLAVLHHSLPTVLVGLDGANAHIRPWLTGPGYALQEAVAYVAPAVTTPWPAWWGAQPANYRVLTRTSLPSTETGAVDVARLGGLQPSGSLLTRQEPRSALERQIRDIWAQVLKQPQIGVLDNFFELGGHSLLATQVVARMQQAFQVEIPVRQLFESPTIAELARVLEQQQPSSDTPPPLQRVARDQKIPLSFAQQRLWFLDQLEPGSSTYTIPREMRLRGKLDRRALWQALHEVILRHENLRTTFPSQQGEPWQQISPQPLSEMAVVDLRFLSPETRTEQARLLAQQEAAHPFDLARGPLLRSWLLQLAAEEQVLLLTLHHIISDGWSSGRLIEELTRLYLARQRGEAATLPALPVQYADYALWQRSWLQGEVLARHLDYWKTRLAGLSPLNLPTDHPRPAILSFQGAKQHVLLPADLSTQLQTFSQREGVTLFMTLLAAFQVLLTRYSGQQDIAVGSPIANRTHQELEGLIGFFVNMLVLRSDLADNPSFRDLLAQVRTTTLDAYAHQDVPFEQVVEAMPQQREGNRSPLFQVAFVLQNAPDAILAAEQSPLQVEEDDETLNNSTAKFELTMIMSEGRQGLHATLEYATELFSDAFIARFLAHWQHLLRAIVANPDQRIQALPLLDTAKQQAPVPLAWHVLPPARVLQYEQILGQALDTTTLLVLDEALQPVPADVVGQLYIEDLHAHNTNQQIQELFIPDPWSDEPEARLYGTGDRVRYRSSGRWSIWITRSIHARCSSMVHRSPSTSSKSRSATTSERRTAA
nr:SDR family NAD(P)-dependent oxidoreductase [Ktedonobacter sp. SOSP1-52]